MTHKNVHLFKVDPTNTALYHRTLLVGRTDVGNTIVVPFGPRGNIARYLYILAQGPHLESIVGSGRRPMTTRGCCFFDPCCPLTPPRQPRCRREEGIPRKKVQPRSFQLVGVIYLESCAAYCSAGNSWLFCPSFLIYRETGSAPA